MIPTDEIRWKHDFKPHNRGIVWMQEYAGGQEKKNG